MYGVGRLKYKDHTIHYDQEAGLVIMPFIDRNTGEEHILVKDANSEGPAVYLEDLETTQCLELSDKLDINHTYKNLLVDNAADIQNAVIIARVDSTPDDRMRVVYSGTEDTIPVYIADAEQCEAYNDLDVGHVIVFPMAYYNYNRVRVERLVAPSTVDILFKAATRARAQAAKEYHEFLANNRKQYVEKFLAGELEEIFLDIFTVRDHHLYYTDVVIEIEDDDNLAKALKFLAALPVNALTETAINRRDNREEEWYGFDRIFVALTKKATRVKLNGIEVSYFEKNNCVDRNGKQLDITYYYVNGKRISTDDVDTVLSAVSCHEEQKTYDEYVDSISKISLKFHRAIAFGLELIDEVALQSEVNVNGRTHFTGTDTGREDTRGLVDATKVVSARLPVRKKSARKKAQVHLLGKWRSIESFDSLVTALSGRSSSRRSSRIYDGGTSIPYRRREVLKKLAVIDYFLAEEDRVFKLGTHYTEDPSYIQYRGKFMTTNAGIEALEEIIDDYFTMFKDSIEDQSDVMKRSKELFDNIVEQEDVEIADDASHFIVTGESGRRYKVKKNGSVTDLSTNRYICIVNGGTRDLGGWDYLTSLVIALVHDNRTAKRVNTLKDD